MSVPKKTTVWLYTCAKQPEQDDAIERMKREVEKQGLTVIGISSDHERRIEPLSRPGIQDMLNAIREGKAGAVMMPGLHHISRQTERILPEITELQEQGTIIYAKDPDAIPFLMHFRDKGGAVR